MAHRSSGAFSDIPNDLWVDILGRLEAEDLTRAVQACAHFQGLAGDAWRAACFRRWPRWAGVAAGPCVAWSRQHELLALREAEEAAVADVAAIKRRQGVVLESHRTILAEWLCEVGGWGVQGARCPNGYDP